jgi:hypothetical protein
MEMRLNVTHSFLDRFEPEKKLLEVLDSVVCVSNSIPNILLEHAKIFVVSSVAKVMRLKTTRVHRKTKSFAFIAKKKDMSSVAVLKSLPIDEIKSRN